MRIISGFLKGKKIDFLKSSITRPLRDYVKESIFNIINHSNFINVKLENTNVLDLYSGVGSFGIECVSRGAKKIMFVENDIKALSILKKNIDHLKIKDKSEIFNGKVINYLNNLNSLSKKNTFEIFFLDPPFAENFFLEDLKIIKNYNIFSQNHLVIIHRERKTKDDFSEILNILFTKTYGRSKVIFARFNLSNF